MGAKTKERALKAAALLLFYVFIYINKETGPYENWGGLVAASAFSCSIVPQQLLR